MSVLIGSARIDENGKARGGKAGDQRGGREVSTQAWYRHSKGWRVFRAKDPTARERIALCMEWACATDLIGYDQGERNTLYNAVKAVGFDVRRLGKPVETDCSALVRVCCAYGGITLPDFYTATEPRTLLASGAFDELTGSKYTDALDYLMRGDILVTRGKGHTAVVLSNGGKAMAPAHKRMTIHKGDDGDDVKALQQALIGLGYALPKYGADGEYGAETVTAVKAFQRDHGLAADGICGPLTWTALDAAVEAGNGHSGARDTLRKGDKGEAVKALQRALVGLGYDLSKYGADGEFGDETLAVVKKFQRNHGLSADGIVGPKTWAALDAAIA